MGDDRRVAVAAVWDAATADLLDRTKLSQSDELPTQVNAATRAVASRITIYLIDHEQERLWPLAERHQVTPASVAVEGTAAGQAFRTVCTQSSETVDDGYRLWVPMIDGSERLGVAEVLLDRPPADPELFQKQVERLIGLVGHLVTVKLPYGDALQRTRRSEPMSASGELLLHLLPPLTFSTERIVVSAILEPCYDVGGDAFDYAVDGDLARFMVLDGMGRGLSAGLTSAAAIAGIRAARRAGGGIGEMAEAADTVLSEQFPDLRYVTGVLAELDLNDGGLRYLNAGHPPPMLIRDGRVVHTLTDGRRMPLGLAEEPAIGTATLEPGDRLLMYTDGVTEAYDRGGERFGTDRLAQLAEQCMAEELPAPETLRRLARTVLAHQNGRPADDATFMLVEWSRAAAERTQP